MKQMDECLDRAFAGKEPLQSKKWKGFIRFPYLILLHYHHVILVYDLRDDWILKQWWEKPADKRGLEAAKEYLKNRPR